MGELITQTEDGRMKRFCSKPIPKRMLHAMWNAHQRYKEAEDHRKKVNNNKYY